MTLPHTRYRAYIQSPGMEPFAVYGRDLARLRTRVSARIRNWRSWWRLPATVKYQQSDDEPQRGQSPDWRTVDTVSATPQDLFWET